MQGLVLVLEIWHNIRSFSTGMSFLTNKSHKAKQKMESSWPWKLLVMALIFDLRDLPACASCSSSPAQTTPVQHNPTNQLVDTSIRIFYENLSLRACFQTQHITHIFVIYRQLFMSHFLRAIYSSHRVLQHLPALIEIL